MNGDPTEKDIYDKLHQLSSGQALSSSQVGDMKKTLDALVARGQFSWTMMLSFTGATITVGFVVWGMFQQAIGRAVDVIKAEMENAETIRAEMRADSLDNRARIGTLETSLEGFTQETKAKEIEVESQFKSMGEMVNLRNLYNMQAHCRMDQKECTPLEYWPPTGRTVSNGNGK